MAPYIIAVLLILATGSLVVLMNRLGARKAPKPEPSGPKSETRPAGAVPGKTPTVFISYFDNLGEAREGVVHSATEEAYIVEPIFPRARIPGAATFEVVPKEKVRRVWSEDH